MPLDKKVKNNIKTSFVINTIIIVGFLLLILSSILPSFNEIEDRKTQLSEMLYSKEQVLKKGIEYEEFDRLSLMDESVDKTFMKKIDTKFYTKNFINNKDLSYKEFLEEKGKEVGKYISSEDFAKKQEKIKNVLPTYSEFSALDSDLTNPRFVNYIESIFETFNLTVDLKEIGISKISLVEDKEEITSSVEASAESSENTNNKAQKKQKDTEIFYTPMEFSVLGQKKDFLDFIYFATNVGNIEIKNGEIAIHKDDEIKSVIKGDERTKDYNIYENQIMEIISIKMEKYIDSLSNKDDPNAKDLSLVKLIQETKQGKEIIKVEMEINFYMRGIPSYKIRELINSMKKNSKNLTTNIKNIKQEASKGEGNLGESAFTLRKIEFLEKAVKLIDADIKGFEGKLIKIDIDKEVLYKDMLDYSSRIDNIKFIVEQEAGKWGVELTKEENTQEENTQEDIDISEKTTDKEEKTQ